MNFKKFAVRAISLVLNLALLITGFGSFQTARAADHRDSNAVDGIQEGDFSDVFAYVDPARPNNVVLAFGVNVFANPNLNRSYRFGEELLYQMKINNGGSNGLLEDLVVQFKFTSVGGGRQSYEVRIGVPETNFFGPAPNKELAVAPICSGSVYHGAAADAGTQPGGQIVFDGIGGSQCFAGVRDDSFVTDVAQAIFRIGLNPDRTANAENHTQEVYRGFTSTAFGPLRGRPLRLDGSSGVDGFGGFNLTSVAVGIPKDMLRGSGINDEIQPGRPFNPSLIGVWGTVSRPKSENFSADGTMTHSSHFIQFERMGQQLASTVWNFNRKPANTTPYPAGPTNSTASLKDRFNAQGPETDIANWSEIVPDSLTVNNTANSNNNTIAGRALLLTAGGFTTPVAGTPLMLPQTVGPNGSTRQTNTDPTLMRRLVFPDVMRLNIDLTPSSVRPGAAAGSNTDPVLGLLGYGVQNGRRPTDDVTDIYLRMARELTDVKFPDTLLLPGIVGLVPGSGAQGTRRTLQCNELNVTLVAQPLLLQTCEDARIFNVLQGTDWIKTNPLEIPDLTISGESVSLPAAFPYLGINPTAGEPGTVGFPEQQ